MLAIPEPSVAFVEPEGARLRVVLPLGHAMLLREVPVPEILLSRATVTTRLSPVQIGGAPHHPLPCVRRRKTGTGSTDTAEPGFPRCTRLTPPLTHEDANSLERAAHSQPVNGRSFRRAVDISRRRSRRAR
jgi:hypothetical protein